MAQKLSKEERKAMARKAMEAVLRILTSHHMVLALLRSTLMLKACAIN